MLIIYKFLSKILQIILNMLFVIQITLIILVFLTATYWFLNLINLSAFDFVKPIADLITDFVKLFYSQEVEIGRAHV